VNHTDPLRRRALAALRRELSEAEVRAFFADVRAAPDAALLAPAGEPARAADPTLSAVTALLAPFQQTSREKARLLAAHLEKLVGRKLPAPAQGLAPTIRALKRHLSDDDIRDGAFSLRVALGERREPPVQKG